ncbi:hypothetical protein [Caldibacillus debilis]|uniref:Uncharacterized protein n=1 Tax=Caldibacillus debilis GB1 TaxID=1339248 RepID=A0A420VE50_9BACI|nr:hypothetical protein [Caldibacillus debilis]RKO61678.1 hypothetical protein Cdeb_01149 [Caldibacillus debilis GB1]
MKNKEMLEIREDVLLRQMYETGELTAEEFLERLFSTEEADKRRRSIVKRNERIRQLDNVNGEECDTL